MCLYWLLIFVKIHITTKWTVFLTFSTNVKKFQAHRRRPIRIQSGTLINIYLIWNMWACFCYLSPNIFLGCVILAYLRVYSNGPGSCGYNLILVIWFLLSRIDRLEYWRFPHVSTSITIAIFLGWPHDHSLLDSTTLLPSSNHGFISDTPTTSVWDLP
jgi:hypothetical protein